MSVELSLGDGVATIALHGDIVETATTDLRNALLEVLSSDHVVLDLRTTTSLDQVAVDSVLAADELRNLMGRPLTVLRGTGAIYTVPVPGARLPGTLRSDRRLNRRGRRRRDRRRGAFALLAASGAMVAAWVAEVRWR